MLFMATMLKTQVLKCISLFYFSDNIVWLYVVLSEIKNMHLHLNIIMHGLTIFYTYRMTFMGGCGSQEILSASFPSAEPLNINRVF